MKNEKGITLAALVLYVIVFSATIALLASLSRYVYKNIDNINSEAISSEEFNKFNVHFVKDVKESKNAKVDSDSNGNLIITLESGARYTYVTTEKSIYKDKEKIARNICNFTAISREENNKNIIEINISTGKDISNPSFNKTIKYVLRYW